MKVVIIGAGAAGLGIGWRLAQSGARVTVLERAQPGRGATWAAAGMLAPVGEGITGAEGEFGLKSRRLWPTFAAELEDITALDLDYRENGALLVAMDGPSAEKLRQRTQTESGLTLLNADQAREHAPMLATPVCAAWAQAEAQVDSRALGRALTVAYLRAGGALRRYEAATSIEVTEDRVIGVRSQFGFHQADAFVIAAGAWTGRLQGLPEGVVPPVIPVKGEMLAMSGPKAMLPTTVIWGEQVYLVPRRDRLLIGATVSEAGFDTALSTQAARHLRARATELIPALAEWAMVEQWAGLRPGSPDGLPILGPTRLANLFAATGQYRNGILFAPALAEVMAQTILEGHLPPQFAAFDPRRFA